MMTVDNVAPSFYAILYDVLDGFVDEFAPNGIAGDVPMLRLTNRAFDHYIAVNGLPTTANACRRMFEWAAALENTWLILSEMEQPTTPEP